ncbi:MAG TPA: type I 3-dehydroquinate dehydratase [Thermoanaerobaculia bacterium]
MKLVATVTELPFDAALDADIIELRADRLGLGVIPSEVEGSPSRIDAADPSTALGMTRIRALTSKPLLLTYRGRAVSEGEVRAALEANIDLVDVEWPPRFDVGPYRDRVVLSHHDFDGFPDVAALLRDMRALGCAHTKLAVTPRDFADNETLLREIAPGVTVIGMGERGLYSRILAPFLGSELCFAGAKEAAAPGQLTLQRAREIFGDAPVPHRDGGPPAVFAIAGNPAGHSLSPSIHNRLFREKGANAAYTIASVERFAELEDAFLAKRITGLSITAPFKEEAFRFAQRIGATIGENARDCEAINTLVHIGGEIVADNTDVDGFTAILAQLCGRDRKSVAIVGAGGTARAALVAVRRAGMHVTVFNRSPREFVATRPLEELASFDGEILIDTLPVAIELPLRATTTLIRAAYTSLPGHPATRPPDYSGLDLLHAQAQRQHELFMKAMQ